MALAALSISQHAAFHPPPLHIHKKPRKTTFRDRVFRRSTHHLPINQYMHGPLDDIIDEIKSNIWESPFDYNTPDSTLNPTVPLEVASTWTATPLPISRLPSNQPLTIRKNREIRSSASGFSMEDGAHFLRKDDQEYAFEDSPTSLPASTEITPWPLLNLDAPQGSANLPNVLRAAGLNAQEAFQCTPQNVEDCNFPTKRRPSVLRLFTGLSRLRRTDTGDTSGNDDASNPLLPNVLEARENGASEDTSQEPSEDAVEAYIRRNARNGARPGSITRRIARRLPSPVEHSQDHQEIQNSGVCKKAQTTLRAAVKVFSEAAQLYEHEQQEFWVAIEVEGALHNRVPLLDGIIDVIFIVDNAYYVSRECLSRALDAVNSALYHLGRGDRVALYTTHCTHQVVTGNRPDELFPIGPLNADTESIFHDLIASITKCGTQAWWPPRPNPSMVEVILGIARSLENKDLKAQRTQFIILSPAAHSLHDVSKSYPDFCVHQINPASVPYCQPPGLSRVQCTGKCCKNVHMSNWTHLQSLPGRIKLILKHARSTKPVEEISQVCIDLRVRDGCEIIECLGSKDIASLRLGQVHTIFAKIRTTRSATKAVDLLSKNPVFNSSLNVKGLRQQLQNIVAVGAVKAHLFDVQVYHRNALHGPDCWNYTETPFLIVRDLGGLAPPLDIAVEVHKRRLFHKFVQHDATTAQLEAKSLLSVLEYDQGPLKKFVQCVLREVGHYQQVLEYEQEHRQKFPLCPGPIALEAAPQDWLVDM